MRIYLKLSPNTEPVPFGAEDRLVSVLHRWLGRDNRYHDKISDYSMSWLRKGKIKDDALDFKYGSEWFISSPNEQFINRIINGVWKNPEVFCGMQVDGIEMKSPPAFKTEELFVVENPVFIKYRKEEERQYKHYTFRDVESPQIMTDTLRRKMRDFGLPEEWDIHARFDTSYEKARTKIFQYKNVNNKTNICPVILTGHPLAIAFAWDVGIGNSTGIGLGSLR